MTNIRQILADNLKTYRNALGLSQANFAKKVGTSAHYIGMIETRNKFPSPEMLERLASALGVDPSELFYKDINPSATVKSFQKAALADLEHVMDGFIAEKLKELEEAPP
jgi:transcriptional regulator with XRE-family HTH domain